MINNDKFSSYLHHYLHPKKSICLAKGGTVKGILTFCGENSEEYFHLITK